MTTRQRKSQPYPLAEVFGYPPDNQTAEAQLVRAQRGCPFNNPSGVDCTKDKRQDPLGVCSIQHNDHPVITCPVRFHANRQLLMDADQFFFPQLPVGRFPRTLYEVPLPDRSGKSAGNIDIVRVVLDADGYVEDYGAIEVQAVYISGNVRGVFSSYMRQPEGYSNNWSSVGYPRPDYLSSSRKRLAPQLIFKGSILNQWRRKIVVAVQSSFFATLPALVEVAREQADITWLIYDLQLDLTTNRYALAHTRTVYTEFAPALTAITEPNVGNEQVFIERLQKQASKSASRSLPQALASLADAEIDPDQV